MGWEHETQLGYTAPNGGGRFEKIDMDSCISEVESGTHAADPPTDNQCAGDGVASLTRIQAVLLCIGHTNQSISLFKFTAGELH